MLGTEYLTTFDGSLLPISNFEGCLFILFFTKSGSRKCFDILCDLKSNNIERSFTNIIFVHVSMDTTFHAWDSCVKNPNWLQFPYYPVNVRKRLFKRYRVDRLPFMVACSDDNQSIVFPPTLNDLSSLEYVDFIATEVSYYTNLFSIDDFVIL